MQLASQVGLVVAILLWLILPRTIVRRRLRCRPIGAIGVRAVASLAVLLALLLRLVDRIDDAEVVLGVLEIRFCHNTITAAGRVSAKFQLLLKQLLGRATKTQGGTIAVEDVIAIKRNITALMPGRATATSAIITAAHAFYIH